MKKYIRIHLRSLKEPIYLSIEKWQGIVNDDKTLVAFTLDSETEWQGKVLNKSEVTYSEYDEEYTNARNEEKYTYYKNKETNSVVKMLDGQLPDNFSKYEKL